MSDYPLPTAIPAGVQQAIVNAATGDLRRDGTIEVHRRAGKNRDFTGREVDAIRAANAASETPLPEGELNRAISVFEQMSKRGDPFSMDAFPAIPTSAHCALAPGGFIRAGNTMIPKPSVVRCFL